MNPNLVKSLAALSMVSAFVAGCGSDSPGKPETPASASTPASSAQAEHNVIRFADDEDDGGVVLEDEGDAAKLVGVPDDFKAFIVAALLKQQAEEDPTMTDCHPKDQYIVDVIDTAGYAAGGIEFAACTGAQLYWAKVDGQWREVLGGQVYPTCEAFRQYGFPVSVVDKCTRGDKVATYAP
ncbi:hypothetical protein GCM10022234_22630 [Aeromicrobium panaciterrae]|uniref:hypothetical protein n=1 Tax=Aeromicrobium panaciterrae TaxID=363861 RepID=UPI0031DACF5D